MLTWIPANVKRIAFVWIDGLSAPSGALLERLCARCLIAAVPSHTCIVPLVKHKQDLTIPYALELRAASQRTRNVHCHDGISLTSAEGRRRVKEVAEGCSFPYCVLTSCDMPLTRLFDEQHDVRINSYMGNPLEGACHQQLKCTQGVPNDVLDAFGQTNNEATCAPPSHCPLDILTVHIIRRMLLHGGETFISDTETSWLLNIRSDVSLVSSVGYLWHIPRGFYESMEITHIVEQSLAHVNERLAKCILVTGGLGFIGSHVVDRVACDMPHAQIVVVDNATYSANIRNVRNVSYLSRFVLEVADVSDVAQMTAILKKYVPDTVYHLAAETHVDKSFGNSLRFTKSNVFGTHALLESLRLSAVPARFVHMSTDEVYGSVAEAGGDGLHPATSLLSPSNPYAASKAAAEMYCMAYRHSFGIPIIMIRCNNVYGPRQYPEKVIPRFIYQMLHKVPCTLHGKGTTYRSFLHATDAARAFVHAACTASDGQIINVHSPDEVRINTLVGYLEKAFETLHIDISNTGTRYVPDRSFNDVRYYVDGKMLAALGWKPTVPFLEGLRDTIQWYIKNESTHFLPHVIDDAVYTNGHGNHSVFMELKNKCKATDDNRVLLFGSTGWVGSQFKQLLVQHGFVVQDAKSRLQNTKALYEEIANSGALHVVNCAGITGRPNIDWCESYPEETVMVNLEGAVTLAQICQVFNKHLTNFATGCIYTYEESPQSRHRNPQLSDSAIKDSSPYEVQGYSETDPPNFFESTYSRTKAYAEALQRPMSNVLILRLRMPINEDFQHSRNLVNKLLNYTSIIDTPNSVSVLPTLLPLALHMMRNKKVGVYNFTNPGYIAPSEILNKYNTIREAKHAFKCVAPDTLMTSGKIIAARSNCWLSTDKLERVSKQYGLSIPDAKTAVSAMINVQQKQPSKN